VEGAFQLIELVLGENGPVSSLALRQTLLSIRMQPRYLLYTGAKKRC